MLKLEMLGGAVKRAYKKTGKYAKGKKAGKVRKYRHHIREVAIVELPVYACEYGNPDMLVGSIKISGTRGAEFINKARFLVVYPVIVNDELHGFSAVPKLAVVNKE